MDPMVAAAYGFAGGVVVDGFEFYQDVKRNHGRIPVRWKRIGMWIAEFVRLGIGSLLAAVLASGGQLSDPVGAFTIGVAAPLMVEKLKKV